jgi:hypothetical protein
MDGKIIETAGTEGVDTGICPHVRSAATVLSKLEIVDVRSITVFEHED